MKKLALIILVALALISCHQAVMDEHRDLARPAAREAYYTQKTNEISRVVKGWRLNPADLYASYSAFVPMR